MALNQEKSNDELAASVAPAGGFLGYRYWQDQAFYVSTDNAFVTGALVQVAGQPILTVIDPNALWVQANVDETQVGRVRPGQPVEVSVDTLGQTLPGRVVAVGRATAATFSLIPQNNTAGNFTKVTQLLPVKIAVDYGQLPLILGSSVEVRIQVQG
jgi:multidrug resistance efflux pump